MTIYDFTESMMVAHNALAVARKEFNDMAWAERQPKGKPAYRIGDVVEFHAGGFGEVVKVSDPHNGWPSSYQTKRPYAMPAHSRNKAAWHYEGDFKEFNLTR